MDDYKKLFVAELKKMSSSRFTWEVWSDLTSAMACYISNLIDLRPEHYVPRKEEYEHCCERLGGENKARKFINITSEALTENPEQDFLGEIFMELELGSHWKGQFFTPYSICKFMTEVSVNSNISHGIKDYGFARMYDPTCGAGATLIAGVNKLRKSGINYQRDILAVGQDIDRTAGNMCYIQLSLLGCAGYVCIADTLSNPLAGNPLFPVEAEGQDIWITPQFASEIWNSRRELAMLKRELKEKSALLA